MRASKRAAVVIALAMSVGLVSSAEAGPSLPYFMKLGRPAPAPPGFLAFCARMPDQCGLDPVTPEGALERSLYTKFYWPALFASGDSTRVAATPQADANESSSEPALSRPAPLGVPAPPDIKLVVADANLMAAIARVNRGVNKSIRYVSDAALYGDENYWHFALGPGEPAAGDCKDYVLEKRRALMADGINPTDLSIAIVETPWRQSHAVLLVSTDRGELVLDSLSDEVKPWWKVGYRWIERQAPGRQLDWVSIG